MPAEMIATMRKLLNAASIWLAVYLGNSLLSAGLMLRMSASEAIRLAVLMAAPAYMSLIAFCTGWGTGDRSGSMGLPLDG